MDTNCITAEKCEKIFDAVLKKCMNCFLNYSNESINVNQKYSYELSIIHIADSQFLKIIFDKWGNEIDINSTDLSGYTALHIACSTPLHDEESFERIKFLIDKRIDVNIQNKHKKTALHFVTSNIMISKITISILTYMLKNNADPNIKDFFGNHLLKNLIRKTKIKSQYSDCNIKYVIKSISILFDYEVLKEDIVKDARNYMLENDIYNDEVENIFKEWEERDLLKIKEPIVE